MPDAVYQMDRLESSGGIDVPAVRELFPDLQAYFKELDAFLGESKHYLNGYTAAVVIYNEDVRKNFLEETQKIKDRLQALGMVELAASISELEGAAGSDSAETLADWILRFHAQIDNIVKLLRSARTDEAPAGKAAEKQVILAVDDKPELLSAIVEVLSAAYRVIAVTSGSAALNAIRKYTPALFLLDIEMPYMNGYEVAKAIRGYAIFETTPIIFLTGKNTRDDVIKAIQNGGNDYLLKPVEKELLLGKIKHYLG